MRQRVLGRTGLSVSEIGFGCGPTAGLIAAGQHDAQLPAVQRALELGINYFDTAPLYGAGASERTLGALLRELHASPRIATKVALAESDFGNIRDAILRSVEGSLARLEQPRLSVLHLHNRIGAERAPKAAFGSGALLSIEDVLGTGGVVETFESLRAEGIVDFFGCSAYGGDMSVVERVLNSGAFDCLQIHYSLMNATAWRRPPEGAKLHDYHCIASHAAALGMGVIVLRALEAGVLTQQPPRAVGADGDASKARIASLAALLDSTSLTQAALRYALSRPAVATVLIGFSNVAQVEEAAASAAQGPLSPTLLSRIQEWQAQLH